MDIVTIETLIMELLSAFFGFLFAMLLNNYIERRAESKQNGLVIRTICEELKEIEKIVDDYIFRNQPPRTAIQIPAWDTVVNSGLLIKLIKSNYYMALVKCYSYIKLLNEDIKLNENDRGNMERLRQIDESLKDLDRHLGFIEKKEA